MLRKRQQVLGADLNRWQGARPGLGESLADRGGDSAVADPSHVRRLACERSGPMVIEAPRFNSRYT